MNTEQGEIDRGEDHHDPSISGHWNSSYGHISQDRIMFTEDQWATKHQ
jgi:hypothetical protein